MINFTVFELSPTEICWELSTIYGGDIISLDSVVFNTETRFFTFYHEGLEMVGSRNIGINKVRNWVSHYGKPYAFPSGYFRKTMEKFANENRS